MLKVFEKFLKKRFSSQISSKPPSSQETEHEKKAPRVPSNKRGSQYFERRKILQLQKFILM
jgi:hypothetical protein